MSLPPSEILYQEQHIHQSHIPATIATVSVFGSIAFALLIARVVVRVRGKCLGLDDYLIIAGGITTLVEIAAVAKLSHLGIGRHVIAIPPENFVPLGKWTVVEYFAFPLSIALIKWSILAQIARVFTMRTRLIKIGVWVMSVYTFLWLFGEYLANGLGCRPFDSYWSATAQCELPWTDTEAATILNIIGDVVIVLLPQPTIWRLKMSMRKKLGVSVLIGLGLFCCATGVVRICEYKKINKYDGTYLAAIPLLFTLLESLVGMIAACIPALYGQMFRVLVAAREGLVLLSNRSMSRSRSSANSQQSDETSDKRGSESASAFAGDVESQNAEMQHIHRKTEIHVTQEPSSGKTT